MQQPDIEIIEDDEPKVYTLGHPGLVSVSFDPRGEGGVVLVCPTGGTRKSVADADDQRKELIERSRRGEHIELQLEAVTYRQHDDHPDANYSDFSPAALARMAKTAPGTAFLRDHLLRDTAAVGGFCESCKLETLEDGTREMKETIVLSKPWAVESVLDGTMRRFSIGARPQGGIKNVICRVCGDSVAACGHYPGEVVETRSGPQTVVWRYKDAIMLERSWVLDPAVENTHIIGWVEKARQGKTLSMSMDTRDTKSDPVAQAAPDLERDALKAANADLTAAVAKLRADLAAKDAELATFRAETESKAIEGQIAELLKTGKLAPNGTQEKQIRERVAGGDLAGAKALLAFAAEAPAVTPAGAPRQSAPQPGVTFTAADGRMNYEAIVRALPEFAGNVPSRYRTAAGAEAYVRTNKDHVSAKLGIPVEIL